jgi:DNA-binding beta-propeller fold protein YncE
MITRVIDVGNGSNVEAPHDMIISPDGKYFYLSYFASSLFQKYNADNGKKEGEVDLGTMSWHAIAISGNGRYAICSHFDGHGKVILLDLWNMSVVFNYQGSGLFQYPHGCAFNNEGTLAYVTCFEGNYLYKIGLVDPSDPVIEKVILQPGEVENHNGYYKPYEVDFCPDHSKYYVTCQGVNEVRVYNTANDSLIKVIPTTGVPQLIAFSRKHPYAFVSCIEDVSGAATKSSVNIINTNSDQVIKSIDPGYQPRGIAVDDDNECVWIANRNVNGLGITPHHSTLCEGNKGYVTLIEMSTLELKQSWKTEVGVDPYCVAIRP